MMNRLTAMLFDDGALRGASGQLVVCALDN